MCNFLFILSTKTQNFSVFQANRRSQDIMRVGNGTINFRKRGMKDAQDLKEKSGMKCATEFVDGAASPPVM